MATQHASIKRLTSNGFTIVELLIVVVVLAILAAIVVVSYNGITRSAAESSIKSDLRNSASLVESAKVDASSDTYPTVPSQAKLAQSAGNTVTYFSKPYGYCISGINPRTNKSFAIRSASKVIAEGNCDVTVTTFAGSTSGYQDGTGTAAQFAAPAGIIAGNNGTLYVSDRGNKRIRQISQDGTVSLLSGTGVSGQTNGPATTSQFDQPGKLSIDASGTLYVSDGSNHVVRKINTSTGATSFFAGIGGRCNFGRGNLTDGSSSVARLDGPIDIASDSKGVFYIAENLSKRVRAVQQNGTVSTYAGSGALNSCVDSSAATGDTNGDRLSAMFGSPTDILIDKNDTIYISDSPNNAIKMISKEGTVSPLTTNLNGAQQPKAIVMDAQGTIYSAGNHGIYSISPAGTIALVAGSAGQGYVDGSATAARFNTINDITFNSDQTALYIADTANNRIRKLSL